ncbi:Pre-mRNA-splicing factor SPF27 [Hypoxylon sp. NC1633]|nr:Pre-mRNA-splicing factor SPF27 [Hypoxylon sp. NC1633]
MSSIRTTVHESLPYVDPEPTPTERAAAESLIQAETSSSSPQSTTSTSPPPPYTPPKFTPIMEAELSRISTKQPLRAIDLSRYEADPSSTTTATQQATLTRAYTASTYLSSRETHLQLLEAYGKNAWLVGNWQAEAELRALEHELASTKKEIDVVNIQRRRAQDDIGSELRSLDDAWRRGVGRMLETEVATEGLRRDVLEKQRARA